MIFGLSPRALWRWYVVVPGLLLTVALAAGAYFLVPPTFQRTATLLLVPGAATVPEDGNPYFYLAGLTQAADVVVRAVGSENVQRDISDQYPGVSFQVARDPTTAGPVITIVVNASDDEDAEAVVATLVKRATDDLEHLQVEDSILPSYRIQIRPVSIDDHSTLRNRTRLVAAAGVGFLGVVAVALVAVVLAFRAARRDTDRDVSVAQNDVTAEPQDLAAPVSGWGWDAEDEAGAAPPRSDESSLVLDPDAQMGTFENSSDATAAAVDYSEEVDAGVTDVDDNDEAHQKV